MTSLSLSLKLSAVKTLSAVQRAINILKSAGPGAWYDPSDLTTLFQDSTGTTPVTAVEQPVGLMLDKSQGLVLGAELVSSLDFATWGSSGVTLKSGNSFTTSWWGGCWLAVPGWSSSKSYRINLTGACTSSWYLRNADFGLDAGSVSVPAGAFSLDVTVTSMLQNSNGNLYIQTVDAGVFTATLFSLKELPGNHAIQPTATSRPTLSSRYNMLMKTEQFDDAYWTGMGGSVPVRVANDAVAPDGTTTADKLTFSTATTADMSLLVGGVSGLVTGGSYVVKAFVKAATPGDVGKSIVYRSVAGNSYSVLTLTTDYQQISLTAVAAGPSTDGLSIGLRPSEGGSTGTVSVHIWGASLTTASDAALPYQRVNTATDYDYDFSKFPPYLKFDGVDDSMYTAASVDFTSTDKMTVFAGVHKASDAGIGVLAETSTGALSGSFWLSVPATVGGPNVLFQSKGTIEKWAITSSLAAPLTRVVTGVGDISGDRVTLRLNGTQTSQDATDQGTGNYGNYPLYIGRRNNASLPFNGRIYQLALKGKAMTAAEISTLESYINSKTKAF